MLDASVTAPCTLVLSARSDFYADIQTHDALRAAVQDCQVSLGPMTAAELTAAIEGPANAVGGSVDPELTKRLLRDIGLDLSGGRDDHYDIGKLPLLEYALEQAWTKADSSRIGLGQYAGLEQALEERANQVFDRLSPEQQAAAKRLFVSLVTPGEGREDTRARFALPADPAMLAAAETFAGASARLIVTGDDASGSRLAEVSHEALIRHWDKLRLWIDENRANLRTRATLVADREEWLAKARDRSLLIEPGLRLEAARRLRDHSGDVVIADIEDYLDASIFADNRRSFRRKAGFVGIAGAAVAMTILAAFGWYQYTTAKSRADETTAALIWSRLDFERTDDPKSKATVRALWDLANGTTAIRDAFLLQLALDRYQVDTVASAPASIVRAFGLRPDREDIARLVGPILDAIPKTTDFYQLQALAQAVQTLGPTPEQAQAALGPVLDALLEITDSYQLQALAQAVQALGPRLTGTQTAIVIEVAGTVLATTDVPAVAEAFATAIAVTLPAEPAEPAPYVAAMGELLKWPTTAGTAMGALLEVLHQRVPEAPGKEAGLDANVAWVADTYPDIDLDSPPTYPASGSTGGAW